MRPWLIVASPFLAGGLFVAVIKGLEWFEKWHYERARRIRNDNLHRYGMGSFKGTKDRWLS